jgi:peptide/nickel transport system permease protein
MIAYLLKRAGQLAILAFLVTSGTFFMSALIPGDYFSRQRLDPAISSETVQQLRHRYGLDEPMQAQYLRWLRNAAHLDFGYSLYFRRPVGPVIGDALSKTLWLGLPALLLGFGVGILMGALHGTAKSRAAVITLDICSTIALSVPTLVLGLAGLFLASRTGWFPLGGMAASVVETSGWQRVADTVHHLILPVACLTIPILAFVERTQSASTRSVMNESWVRAARARGLRGPAIFLHYVVRPSLNPVLSVSGPVLGAVLSGSLVLEVVFSWPGLGRVMYDAVLNNDLHLLVAGAAASAVLLVIGNLIGDLLVLALDPRTRIPGGSQ